MMSIFMFMIMICPIIMYMRMLVFSHRLITLGKSSIIKLSDTIMYITNIKK